MPDDPATMLHVSPNLGSAAFEASYSSCATVNVTVRSGTELSASELVTRQLRALEAARHDLLRAARAREIKVIP